MAWNFEFKSTVVVLHDGFEYGGCKKDDELPEEVSEESLYKLIGSQRAELHVEVFENHLAVFMEMHVSVQRSLPLYVRKGDHKYWYKPKLISFRIFFKEMKKRFKHLANFYSEEVTTEALESSVHPHDTFQTHQVNVHIF